MTNLEKIQTADFAQLRATLTEFSSKELRDLCGELAIAGLSRGSKKACAKAIFDKEVERRRGNDELETSTPTSPPTVAPKPVPEVKPEVKAKTPKAKTPKAKTPKAKTASTKAPKKRAKKVKEPKPPKPPEARTAMPIGDLAESSFKAVEDLMAARGVDFASALDLLVKVGRSRLRATDKYYAAQTKKSAAKVDAKAEKE